jgi:Gram-negative bacterial TonB protein C-terminal
MLTQALVMSLLAFGMGVQISPDGSSAHSTEPAATVCPKAKTALEASRQGQVVVQMVINEKGQVTSFKFLKPDGLHLEKDPDVRNAMHSIHFQPARKDGHTVIVLINMAINCSHQEHPTSQRHLRLRKMCGDAAADWRSAASPERATFDLAVGVSPR